MSPRGWAAFAAMSIIWGVPYLFIKVAVDAGLSPAFVSFARVVIAAAVLLGLAWKAGSLAHLRGRWTWVAAYTKVGWTAASSRTRGSQVSRSLRITSPTMTGFEVAPDPPRSTA